MPSIRVRFREEGACEDVASISVWDDDVEELCRMTAKAVKHIGNVDDLDFRVAGPPGASDECCAGPEVVSLKLLYQACSKHIHDTTHGLPAMLNAKQEGDSITILIAVKAPQATAARGKRGTYQRRPSSGSSCEPAQRELKDPKDKATKNDAFTPQMQRFGIFFEPGRVIVYDDGTKEPVTGFYILDYHRKYLQVEERTAFDAHMAAIVAETQATLRRKGIDVEAAEIKTWYSK